MTAGMSTVDGTQIPHMVWRMALLTAQTPYHANGNSVPAVNSLAEASTGTDSAFSVTLQTGLVPMSTTQPSQGGP